MSPGQAGERSAGGPYLLRGAGDDALLQAVGLLLKVLSGLVVPEQVVFYLETKQVSLKITARLRVT